MTKLEAFISANTPASVSVPWSTLLELCKELKFAVEVKEESKSGREARRAAPEPIARPPYVRITHRNGGYCEIRARETVELRYGGFAAAGTATACYKAEVRFEILTASSGSGENPIRPIDLLRSELCRRFAPPVVVPLPERAVELPVPGWLVVAGEEAWAYSPKMFLSEAREAFKDYMAAVKAVLAG